MIGGFSLQHLPLIPDVIWLVGELYIPNVSQRYSSLFILVCQHTCLRSFQFGFKVSQAGSYWLIFCDLSGHAFATRF